jgi:hypothetical protein
LILIWQLGNALCRSQTLQNGAEQATEHLLNILGECIFLGGIYRLT